MKCFSFLLLLVLSGAGFAACSDDDEPWESFRQDLVDVRTGTDGRVLELLTDREERFSAENSMATRHRDTIYRAYVLYVPVSDGRANVRQVTDILTDHIRIFGEGKVKTDPVELQAVWRGGRYLNFQLSIPVSSGHKAHYFGFADCGRRTNTAGTTTLSLSLYHDKNGDGADYTRKAWMCCRLDGCGLVGGDSIEVAYCPSEGVKKINRLAY